ncbi:MAG: hypothetical protein O2812_05970 [Chloroflexi bacterium]|nr:hypothetical protein [Chloroflexota bacterium]
MSKLTDKFDRASRGSLAPMGFGGQAKREKVASVLLIGIAKLGDKAEVQRIASAGLNGALLTVSGAAKAADVKTAATALKDAPWGVWQDGATADADGSDFRVIASTDTPLSSLGGEDDTNVMVLTQGMDDTYLRALEDLPADAFIFAVSGTGPLTVGHLMEVARVRRSTSKRVIAQLVALPSKEELVQLRDAGVDAIAIEVGGQADKALKDAIAMFLDLPAPKSKKGNRSTATLPSTAAESAPSRREEPEPDEDDDYE